MSGEKRKVGRPRLGDTPLTPAQRKQRQRAKFRAWLATDAEFPLRRKLFFALLSEVTGKWVSTDELDSALYFFREAVNAYRATRQESEADAEYFLESFLTGRGLLGFTNKKFVRATRELFRDYQQQSRNESVE